MRGSRGPLDRVASSSTSPRGSGRARPGAGSTRSRSPQPKGDGLPSPVVRTDYRDVFVHRRHHDRSKGPAILPASGSHDNAHAGVGNRRRADASTMMRRCNAVEAHHHHRDAPGRRPRDHSTAAGRNRLRVKTSGLTLPADRAVGVLASHPSSGRRMAEGCDGSGSRIGSAMPHRDALGPDHRSPWPRSPARGSRQRRG